MKVALFYYCYESIIRRLPSLRLDPKNAEADYNRGIAYKNNASKDKAVQDFKKVLELNDDIELSQKAQEELQKLYTK